MAGAAHLAAAQGAVVGAFVGDAAGAPLEFMEVPTADKVCCRQDERPCPGVRVEPTATRLVKVYASLWTAGPIVEERFGHADRGLIMQLDKRR